MKPYTNNGLFSEHYLAEILPSLNQWKDAPDVKPIFDKLKQLYKEQKEIIPKLNESQLERAFIRPVFEILGHVFEVQPSLLTSEGTKRPDYSFFPDGKTKNDSQKHLGKNEFFTKAVAIGDAKRWGRPLDKKIKAGGDPFDNVNPSWQIDFYLRFAQVQWAILTDGKFFRLYNQNTSFRLDNFYEVDLTALLEGNDSEAFKYFYLFFSREAFVKDPDGRTFLERVYQGSIDYAHKIGQELKENIYTALKVLADGFLQTPGNNLTAEKDLKNIHDNSLVLLYRFLFILYAESRELLPTDNRIYAESYSLRSIKQEVANKIDREETLLPIRTIYWQRLIELFGIINNGTPPELGEEFYVPEYNGGLFDPEKNPFLEKHKVGDSYIAQVIDLICRSEVVDNGGGKAFVDYSSLEIRHLGSIYEGLLEYKLVLAKEDMVAIKEKDKEKWIPANDAGNKKIIDLVAKGGLYLETDKGERKATGSYYTPDYIVKYIVEHTLDPIITEKKKNKKELINEILKLKVLDPAMGSGHFLVEATDFLAKALVEALGESPQEQDEEDIRWARREVVEKCIYGVDLNPLAVELAMLSLWLSTVAKNRPLNFLDHHLRCGNSLIGVGIEDLGALPKLNLKNKNANKAKNDRQLGLFESIFKEKINLLLGDFALIERLSSDKAENIHKKEQYYKNFRKRVARFQDVADVWTSAYFGNEVTFSQYHGLQNNLRANEADWEKLKQQPWFQKAKQIAAEKHFFHWELEFPEVFFEEHRRKDNPGFDVVVGNPPYVTMALGKGQKETEPALLNFLRIEFPCAAEYKTNTYALFIEKSLRIIRQSGLFSMILPRTFLTNYYFKNLRKFLIENYLLVSFVDIQEKVFPEAEIGGNSIPIISINKPKNILTTLFYFKDDRFFRQGKINQEKFLSLPYCKLLSNFNVLNLILKISEENIALEKLATFYNGIKTGDNTKYLCEKPTLSIHKKVIRGRDINRYELDWGGVYVLFDPEKLWSNTDEKTYLANPKIIIRQTGDTLTACYDDESFYTMDTTHLIIPTKKEICLYLLAVLNSNLLNWFHSQIVPEHGKAFAEIKIINLQQLPIPRISFTTPEAERKRLVEELKGLYKEYVNAGVLELLLQKIDSLLPRDTPEVEEKSDVIHDFLAHLAEQMIEMNQQKQQEVKGFLEWLESYLGAKTEGLTNKTKLKAYYETDGDEFLKILKKNSKKITAFDITRREPTEKIQAEFEASISKLRPLLEKIKLADRLIDQIVYKLYRLTDEEIKVVEEGVRG